MQLFHAKLDSAQPAHAGSGTCFLAGLLILFQAVTLAPPESTPIPAELPPGLEPVQVAFAPAADKALRSLGTGVEHFSKGLYTPALTSLKMDPASVAVGDYVLLYRGKSNLMLDRGDEALRCFRLIRSRYPVSPLLTEATLGESQALLKLGNSAGALAVLQNAGQSSDVMYLKARALEEAGRREEAAALYRSVFSDYVNSSSAKLAEQRLRVLRPQSLTGAGGLKLQLNRAENLLAVGRYRDARTLLVSLAKSASRHRESTERHSVLLAEVEFNLGKGMAALKHLARIGDSSPSLHARALYLKAVGYRRIGDDAAFLRTAELAQKLYPGSPWTEKALLSLATYFDVNGELARALDTYRAITRFTEGQYRERALWKVAFYAYTLGRHEDAVREFWNYLEAYPASASPAAPVYWLARSYERLGDSTAALHLYGRARELSTLGYYGQRAAQAEGTLNKGGTGTGRSFSGVDFLKVTAAVSAMQAGGRSHLSAPGESAARIIERARQLLAADLPDLAVSELRSAIALLPEERSLSYVLSRMFERRGDPYNAIVTLRRAFPDYDERPHHSLPPEVWELLFPLRHWETIVANSTKNSLDPHLVLGIIRQESAFQVAARSRANARGLMQVLPSTGRMLARDAGVGRYTVSKLFRPEANIALGTRYLASLMERFGGRVEISLAAYNAGGSRAERWQAEFGHLDMAEFVERIPFSETRGYVKQVLTNMAHYSHLTSPSSSPGQ